MPELPEVQTIVSDLNRKIKGEVITDFWSDWLKTIKGITLGKFKETLKGKKILEVRRIGKNIFVDLTGGKTIYMHLKMTGHLLVKGKKENVKGKNGKDYFKDKVNQYVHHIFYFKSGKTLEFSDLRKFGKIVLADTGKIREIKEIKKLGVDALSKDFTYGKFEELAQARKNIPIVNFLIDQGIISGIGNIYRSEILFESGIMPQRRVKTLSLVEKKAVHSQILKVLKKAVKLRGTSDSDYRDTSGAPGNFQKVLKVYRRDGERCKKCQGMVKRIKMGQRSVFYCPSCQK